MKTMVTKLKQMREQVKEELGHISRWSTPQGELRMIYWSCRMHSLSEKAVPKQTAKEALEESVAYLRDHYANFEFEYDKEFFNQEST